MITIQLNDLELQSSLTSARHILGEHAIKSGRYWYKGHQNCDIVIALEERGGILIQASGGVRFRMSLSSAKRGKDKRALQGKLTVYGWLSDLPQASSVVINILEHMAKEVEQHRAYRRQLEAKAMERGESLPDFLEPIGISFSVKADESKLDERNRIDSERSEQNFSHALRTKWYHRDFVNFCREHGVKCYYRSAYEDVH